MTRPFFAKQDLVDELQRLAPSMTVLVAPAGYGKTTLGEHWLATFETNVRIDCHLVESPDALARAILAGFASSHPVGAEKFGREMLAVSGVPNAAVDMLRDEWRRGFATGGAWFFDNCESLLERPAVLGVLAELLRSPANGRAVVMASRTELGVRTNAFAGPDRTRFVSAEELRFSRDEIGAAFAGRLAGDALNYVEEVTRGWPVAVVLWSQREGGFGNQSLERDGEIFSSADLSGYLRREVLDFCEADTLDALALCALYGDRTLDEDVATLGSARGTNDLAHRLSDVPLVEHRTGTFRLHPLLRESVRRRFPERGVDVARRLAQRYEASGRTLRAAELYHAAGDDERAATSLVIDSAFLLTELPLELANVIASLPAPTLLKHPALWNAATLGRVFLISQHQWLREAESVWRAIDARTPFAVRAGCFSSFANVRLNLGMFRGVDALCEEFLAGTSAAERPIAECIASLWSGAARIYEGKPVDLAALESTVAPLLTVASTRALYQYAAATRHHRIRGNIDDERAALDLSLELAEESAQPLVNALCLMEAIFSAWLADDEARYAALLVKLRNLRSHTSDKGTSFFLACASGDASASVSFETYVDRAYGYLILAEHVVRRSGRERALDVARDAIAAADLSGHLFLRMLARVVVVELAPAERANVLPVMEACIDGFLVGPVRDAFADWIAGNPTSSPMLRCVSRRFGVASEDRVMVWLTTGSVTCGRRDVALTPREREMVCYLAALRRPVAREVLLESIFGDEVGAKRGQLKVYVNRLRKALGKESIVTHDFGYALAANVAVDVERIEAALADARRGAGAAVLREMSDAIARAGTAVVERWPWYVAFEQSIASVESRLGEYLAGAASSAGDDESAVRFARRASAVGAMRGLFETGDDT